MPIMKTNDINKAVYTDEKFNGKQQKVKS